jgi:hypothetical protein
MIQYFVKNASELLLNNDSEAFFMPGYPGGLLNESLAGEDVYNLN